jgi:cell division protease FtsH
MQMMDIKREHQINFWYFIVAFLGIIMLQRLLIQPTHIKTIPYSEFQTLLQQQKVTDLVVGPTTITGTYKEPPDATIKNFSTDRVDPTLAQ